MNPELELLWNDAINRLNAVVADQVSRGIQPMPSSFTPIGSFAHDDPYGHAFARGEYLEGAWSENIAADYCVQGQNLFEQDISELLKEPKKSDCFKIKYSPMVYRWTQELGTAPEVQLLLCAA